MSADMKWRREVRAMAESGVLRRLRRTEGVGSIEAHAIAKGRTRPQLHHRPLSSAVKHSIRRCRYGL